MTVCVYTWPERLTRLLSQDLASVDRKKTPWVVVHGHRPMYCASYREVGEGRDAFGFEDESDEGFSSQRVAGDGRTGSTLKRNGERLPKPLTFEEDQLPTNLSGDDANTKPLVKKKPKWHGGLCSWEFESSRLGLPSACASADGRECEWNANFGGDTSSGFEPDADADAVDTVSKQTFRHGVETLFRKHGVDLVIHGHEHEYYRTWPVWNQTVVNGSGVTSLAKYTDPLGTVFVVTGAGGNDSMDRGVDPPTRGPCTYSLHDPTPWCAFQSGVGQGDKTKGDPDQSSEFAFGVVSFASPRYGRTGLSQIQRLLTTVPL